MDNRYSLTDQLVQRVLECLRTSTHNYGHKSLDEVTVVYNRIYPPSLIRKIIGNKVEKKHILPVLQFLESKPVGLVAGEVFSVWGKVHKKPEKYYVLTQEGIQYVNTKNSKGRRV